MHLPQFLSLQTASFSCFEFHFWFCSFGQMELHFLSVLMIHILLFVDPTGDWLWLFVSFSACFCPGEGRLWFCHDVQNTKQKWMRFVEQMQNCFVCLRANLVQKAAWDSAEIFGWKESSAEKNTPKIFIQFVFLTPSVCLVPRFAAPMTIGKQPQIASLKNPPWLLLFSLAVSFHDLLTVLVLSCLTCSKFDLLFMFHVFFFFFFDSLSFLKWKDCC